MNELSPFKVGHEASAKNNKPVNVKEFYRYLETFGESRATGYLDGVSKTLENVQNIIFMPDPDICSLYAKLQNQESPFVKRPNAEIQKKLVEFVNDNPVKGKSLPLYTYQNSLIKAEGFRDALSDMRGEIFYLLARPQVTAQQLTHINYGLSKIGHRLIKFYDEKLDILSILDHTDDAKKIYNGNHFELTQ